MNISIHLRKQITESNYHDMCQGALSLSNMLGMSNNTI